MASLWLRITEKRDNPPVVRRLDLASLPVEGRLPVLIVLERLDDFVVRKTAKEKTIALSDFTIYYRFGIHRRGGIALLFRDEEGRGTGCIGSSFNASACSFRKAVLSFEACFTIGATRGREESQNDEMMKGLLSLLKCL